VRQKIKLSDLRREAEAMIRRNEMPSLEAILQAVADARERYGPADKGEPDFEL
jgi:hypothetical protein